MKSQNKLTLARTRSLWAYLILSNIATLERSWFNPGMNKYQKWREWTARQEKAARELIRAGQQRGDYRGCSATMHQQDEQNRSCGSRQGQSLASESLAQPCSPGKGRKTKPNLPTTQVQKEPELKCSPWARGQIMCGWRPPLWLVRAIRVRWCTQGLDKLNNRWCKQLGNIVRGY